MAGSSIVTDSLTLRPMTTRDIPIVAGLEREIYPQPWSIRTLFDELSLSNRRYIVAVDDAGVVGYGGLLLVDDDAHITTLAVDPAARRRRLGTRLMLRLVEEALGADARHLTLEVRVSNSAAQHLYERFGFARVGKRKNYYRDEDALVMWATDVDDADYGARLDEIRKSLDETEVA